MLCSQKSIKKYKRERAVTQSSKKKLKIKKKEIKNNHPDTDEISVDHLKPYEMKLYIVDNT